MCSAIHILYLNVANFHRIPAVEEALLRGLTARSVSVSVLLRILSFLRITDEFNNLSLTNLGVYVSMYRLLTVPNASYTEVGTFIMAAAAYNYKKVLSNGS